MLIKKIYHLNTLHLHPAQTRKRTKKESPNSYIKLLNYRHPIVRFLQIRPEIFHSIEYTFYIQGFKQLGLALKNRVCPEFIVLNIHLLSFRIFEQLALALKNRVALKFFTVWNMCFMYFLSFRNF